jgi:hypothetical protein
LGVSRQGQGGNGLSLMPRRTTSQDTSGETPQPLAKRLLWFAALWLAGVASLSLVALGLRLWLAPA